MLRSCSHGPIHLSPSTTLVRGVAGPNIVVELGAPRSRIALDVQLFVRIRGELDAFTADHIQHALLAAATESADLVIDLAGVTFVDNAGLRLLEHLSDRAHASGGRVRLHDPSRSVRRLIDLLGIDRLDLCVPDAVRLACASCAPRGTRRRGTNPRARARRVVQVPADRGCPGAFRLTIDAGTATVPASSTQQGRPTREVLYTACGELDITAIDALLAHEEHGFERFDRVVVDLSGVTLIDNSGMRFIEDIADDVHAAGGEFALRNPSAIVERVAEALGVRFEDVQRRHGAAKPDSRAR